MDRDRWVKANASSTAGHCVEVLFDGITVYVRDSKHPEADVLAYSPAEWRAFVAGVREKEFDL